MDLFAAKMRENHIKTPIFQNNHPNRHAPAAKAHIYVFSQILYFSGMCARHA